MNKRNENANKGFSLVELIIVVAIMAVLIGILAPTYLKYVDKSRVTADQTTVDEFVRAMQVLAADTDAELDSTATTYIVKSDATKGTIDIDPSLIIQLNKAGSIDTTKSYSFKSADFVKNEIVVQLKYDSGNWKVETTGVPDTTGSGSGSGSGSGEGGTTE